MPLGLLGSKGQREACLTQGLSPPSYRSVCAAGYAGPGQRGWGVTMGNVGAAATSDATNGPQGLHGTLLAPHRQATAQCPPATARPLVGAWGQPASPVPRGCVFAGDEGESAQETGLWTLAPPPCLLCTLTSCLRPHGHRPGLPAVCTAHVYIPPPLSLPQKCRLRRSNYVKKYHVHQNGITLHGN